MRHRKPELRQCSKEFALVHCQCNKVLLMQNKSFINRKKIPEGLKNTVVFWIILSHFTSQWKRGSRTIMEWKQHL